MAPCRCQGNGLASLLWTGAAAAALMLLVVCSLSAASTAAAAATGARPAAADLHTKMAEYPRAHPNPTQRPAPTARAGLAVPSLPLPALAAPVAAPTAPVAPAGSSPAGPLAGAVVTGYGEYVPASAEFMLQPHEEDEGDEAAQAQEGVPEDDAEAAAELQEAHDLKALSFYSPAPHVGAVPPYAGNAASNIDVLIEDSWAEFVYEASEGECGLIFSTDLTTNGLLRHSDRVGGNCSVEARRITLTSSVFEGCHLRALASDFAQHVRATLQEATVLIDIAAHEPVTADVMAAASWQLDCDRCNPSEPCCSGDGRIKARGATCRPAQHACQAAALCDGQASTCPANGLVNAAKACEWHAPRTNDTAHARLMGDATKGVRRIMATRQQASDIMRRPAKAFPAALELCWGTCVQGRCVRQQAAAGSCCFASSAAAEGFARHTEQAPDGRVRPTSADGVWYCFIKDS